MKNNIKRVLAIVGIALFFINCSKYPEGPSLSLKSKKNRITNFWEYEKHFDEDGRESTDPRYQIISYEIKKDGTVIYKDGGDFPSSEEGTWSFTNNKENILMDFGNLAYPDLKNAFNFKIIKLKSKELWIKDWNDHIIHYVPK